MKEVVIPAFALALIGMGLFTFGLAHNASTMELAGFYLTVPLTVMAAAALLTVAAAAVTWCAMAAWTSLAWSWAWARAWPRRRRG
jgi:hypothetical protein